MSLVTPSQSNSGDTIEASDINNPVNQLAAVINGNIDATNISDNSVTTTKVADGAILPTKLQSGSGGSWVWQTFTPTWTGTTIGNATVVAKYCQIGKTVHFRIAVTIGSTTAIAGVGTDTTITLPVTSSSTGYIQYVSVMGRAASLHTGTSQFGAVTWNSTTTAILQAEAIVAATNVAKAWNVTNVGISAGDTWGIAGVYEAA